MKPVMPSVGTSTALQAGARVGPYRLIEEIGKGGMGRVFLAERADGEYEQRVALKLINKGEDEEELLPRFYQERQALAMLAHPNIARLLDGGVTDDGQPYLVMEYIEGMPLDVYCDQQQCDISTRVRLFREVLAGVQHAHQHFLVHRDLKPGNILVTDEGTPKLLDFGIVKWLQVSNRAPKLTATGTQPMTLEYASPEQVKGEAVTTVSDVYTLGVLLYELLTGHSPYRKSTNKAYDLQKAICEQEPETPSAAVNRIEPAPAHDQQTTKTLTPEIVSATREGNSQKLRRRLAGDLDSIMLKALRKEPPRRYSSAEQFSEDLRRYLNGQPVSAREATFTYRAAKFVRLHKFGVGAATLVLLLSLGFGLAMAFQVERTKRERDKAQQVGKFLADIFTAADPYQAKGDSIIARELLGAGAARLDSLANPETKDELRYLIGEIYRKLGRYDLAVPLLRAALEWRKRTYGKWHLEVAAAEYNLGSALHYWGKYDEALPIFQEALAIQRKLLGNDHYEVGASANNLGNLLVDQGKLDEAGSLLLEALPIMRKSFPDGHEDVAGISNNLGNIAMHRGDFANGEKHFRESLEMIQKVLPADHPRFATAYSNVAIALLQQGKADSAEPLFREGLRIAQKVYPEGHDQTAMIAALLSQCLIKLQRYEEAESVLLASYQYFRERMHVQHNAVPVMLRTFVGLYKIWGKPQKAEEYRQLFLQAQNASN